MICCTNCFKDPFLKRYIKNNGTLGNCDYCDDEGIKTLEIQQIANMFDIFYPYLEHGENFIHHVHDPTDVGEFLSEIDYLPTQFLAELIKSEGYDGFIFKSALGQGDNIVIFNEDNVKRISMEYYEVNMINYNFKPTLS